jgi:hypothetical protein
MIDYDDDEPAFAPGRWYMFLAPGGFTLVGQYVRNLGMDRHRFKYCAYMLNAGGSMLTELCERGPGPNTRFVAPYPRYWNGTPISWSDWTSDKLPVEIANKVKKKSRGSGSRAAPGNER